MISAVNTSDAVKPRFILPKNPDNYYGITSTIENLFNAANTLNIKIYCGSQNRVEEMILERIEYQSELNSYEIHTDKAILLAVPLTRVSYSVLRTNEQTNNFI